MHDNTRSWSVKLYVRWRGTERCKSVETAKQWRAICSQMIFKSPTDESKCCVPLGHRPAVLQGKRLMSRHKRGNLRFGLDGLAILRRCIVWTLPPNARFPEMPTLFRMRTDKYTVFRPIRGNWESSEPARRCGIYAEMLKAGRRPPVDEQSILQEKRLMSRHKRENLGLDGLAILGRCIFWILPQNASFPEMPTLFRMRTDKYTVIRPLKAGRCPPVDESLLCSI